MPTIITRGAVSAKAYGFGVSGGYSVSKSLRFRSSASAYLNRINSATTNRTTWTYSAWVKRGKLGAYQALFAFRNASNTYSEFWFDSNDNLHWDDISTGATQTSLITSAVYRDPSAWYHVVLVYNSTNATAANRAQLYVNGVQVTAFGTATYPAQNTQSIWNIPSVNVALGAELYQPAYYFDGYLAEVNFIDGQALAASSFGTYDTNGVWQPIKYSGSFGTNGFYLNFGNTTSTTTLGYDTSGNSNNWTTNNISLTAGSTYDSMTDSPTVSSASVANYATLNPLDFQNANTYSNGNLSVSLTNVSQSLAFSGFGLSSGKWYWEVKTTAGTDAMLGVALQSGTMSSRQFTGANSVYYYGGSGTKYVAGTGSAYGATYGTADTIGIALDLSANTITYYKNNASQGAISLPSQLLGVNIVPAFSSGTGTAVQSMNVNFGQQPFTYTPPTGYSALNTYNLPTPTISNGSNYFGVTTYTGNGTTQNIVQALYPSGNTPDLIWLKSRSAATNNGLFDSDRGWAKALYSNTTGAEVSTAGVGGADSYVFSLGGDAAFNANAATYVAWQWAAGGTGVSNTSGSITSTVSANTTAGFSVVTYTGTGANATVGHGLGAVPAMYIIKNRIVSSYWTVYHQSLGNNILRLNTTDAAIANSAYFSSYPTSTLIYNSTSGDVNASGSTYVAYCWSAVAGYSAFGSYTGNGSADGPFAYVGFRPRYVLIKRTDSTGDWYIWDTSRNTYNVVGEELLADTSGAGNTATDLDILSNGFKIRTTTAAINASGGTFVYAAFAENPFQSSRAR